MWTVDPLGMAWVTHTHKHIHIHKYAHTCTHTYTHTHTHTHTHKSLMSNIFSMLLYVSEKKSLIFK